MLGDFPPNSSVTDLNPSAAATLTARPPTSPPVKATFRVSGCLTKTSPTSVPKPVTTFSTPSGNPACVPSRESSINEAEVNSDGFTTTVFPAAKAGASVCHVDAAEGMVKWCRENAALSGLGDAPVRYIADDCLKFVRREVRRERRYDAIIMDPPTYGRGSTGEMWKLEDHLWTLLKECRDLLSDTPLFFLINAYTARLSPTVVANLLAELMHAAGRQNRGAITAGEVGLPVKNDGKVLPCGIYGRWEA